MVGSLTDCPDRAFDPTQNRCDLAGEKVLFADIKNKEEAEKSLLFYEVQLNRWTPRSELGNKTLIEKNIERIWR